MEYLIGSLLTACVFTASYFAFGKAKNDTKKIRLFRSQSTLYDLMGPVSIVSSFFQDPVPMPATQSTDHLQKTTVRILFTEDKAYWISNNCFYEAPIVDGEVDQDSKQPVDTMDLDPVQLEEIVFIVDKLTEGSNNEGNGTGF